MFLSAGFEIAHQYGDYQFVPFDRTSPYVVTMARRHVGRSVGRSGTIDMAPLGSAHPTDGRGKLVFDGGFTSSEVRRDMGR